MSKEGQGNKPGRSSNDSEGRESRERENNSHQGRDDGGRGDRERTFRTRTSSSSNESRGGLKGGGSFEGPVQPQGRSSADATYRFDGSKSSDTRGRDDRGRSDRGRDDRGRGTEGRDHGAGRSRDYGDRSGRSDRPVRRFSEPGERPRTAYLTPKQERDKRRREAELLDDDPERNDPEWEDDEIVVRGRGGRQILKRRKKKKVRVFFSRRLTRILLPKLLIKAKYLSPALARQFIEAGRVRINARIVSSRFYEVNLRKERVTIDDVPAEFPRRVSYMIYNKPRGVICGKGDERFDLLFESESPWCFPYGRLVKSISGLVILSNDPRMIKNQHFTDLELQKEYRIKINRHLTDVQLQELTSGVLVDDDYLVPLRVVAVSQASHTMILDITLLDDSYQKIFKALKSLGCEVMMMRRKRIGHLNDLMVPYGEWRELSGFELSALGISRFTPGELPPEPEPPPRPFIARGRPRFDKPRFSRDDRGGRDDRRPGDRRPDDRRPSDRRPDDRRPDDRRPSDRRPDDRRPSDRRPDDRRPDDRRPDDRRPSDRRPDDRRPSDRRPDDRRPSDRRPDDRRPDDRRPDDRRPSDRRPDDRRPNDRRPDDRRPSDRREEPRREEPRREEPRREEPRREEPRREEPRREEPRPVEQKPEPMVQRDPPPRAADPEEPKPASTREGTPSLRPRRRTVTRIDTKKPGSDGGSESSDTE